MCRFGARLPSGRVSGRHLVGGIGRPQGGRAPGCSAGVTTARSEKPKKLSEQTRSGSAPSARVLLCQLLHQRPGVAGSTRSNEPRDCGSYVQPWRVFRAHRRDAMRRSGPRRAPPGPPWRAQSHLTGSAGSRPPYHADRVTPAHPGGSEAGLTKDRRNGTPPRRPQRHASSCAVGELARPSSRQRGRS